MGHAQEPTSIKTDNSTAEGFFNKTIKPKRSKAFDMKFHWMKDRIQQNQFHLYWEKGSNNWADYFTKHHPPCYHKLMRPKYIQQHKQISCSAQALVQGCVNILQGLNHKSLKYVT